MENRGNRLRQIAIGGAAVLLLVGIVMIAFEPFEREKAGSAHAEKSGNGIPGVTDVSRRNLAGATDAGSERKFVPGQVLVRFRSGTSQAARSSVLGELGASVERKLPVPGLELVQIGKGASVQKAVAAFESRPEVRYAEPNFIYRFEVNPNDTRFGELWGLHNTGQSVNGTSGTADADIDAPEAWNRTTGSAAVKVAVVDSGVAYDHPDLSPNIWANPGESGGGKETNGVDDDGNGFIDDFRGFDFVQNDNNPRDLTGHGTHVAGTIGARGNNGQGVAGVNWQVSLMPVRVGDSSGLAIANIIAGFGYASANGAEVVNASFSGSSFSQGVSDAIAAAPNTLFVVAASNEGTNNDTSPRYPCNYSLANIVCVAATDQDDGLASFSNYGATSVDLGAPGTNILSTIPAYGAPLFSDGFENDITGIWTTGGTNNTWARTSEAAKSGSFSLTDSPGASYLNNTNSFARNAIPFSLSGQQGCQLNYGLRLATESGYDGLLVEASNNPSTFTTLDGWTGSTGGNFFDFSTDVSSFDGEVAAFLRFRLVTDPSVTADGVHIDDVAVRCLTSTFTGAEFQFSDGTSMATPQVAGVAALVLAQRPEFSPTEVKNALLSNVDPVGSLSGKTVTGGRLNADIDVTPPTPRNLTVSVAGSGTGTVTGPGISCPGDCTGTYANGTSVTLNAAGTGGSTFDGWGGACAGTASCQLTMDADKAVSATFNAPAKHTLTVVLAGAGSGTVTSSPVGINCGSNCSAQFNHGQEVTLTGVAAAGSTWGSWTGDCLGTTPCGLIMDADKFVAATFNLLPPPTPPPAPPPAGGVGGATSGQTGQRAAAIRKCKKKFPKGPKRKKCIRKAKKLPL